MKLLIKTISLEHITKKIDAYQLVESNNIKSIEDVFTTYNKKNYKVTEISYYNDKGQYETCYVVGHKSIDLAYDIAEAVNHRTDAENKPTYMKIIDVT